jgi:3-oxoacyl-[acyl-carrier protein] reductase
MLLDVTALSGRTVLLTGASGGIGRVSARVLADAGATVLAHHRSDRAALEAALADVASERVVLLDGDLATADEARGLWQRATSIRRVDVLVLNAAAMPETPVDGSDEDWDAGWQLALAVNVIGAGALMRAAVHDFVAQGSGTVIVLSSWAAEQGSRIKDVSAYAASKAAIRNLAQTFARNYARDGLRVYIVAPGVVDAGMGTVGRDEAELAAVADGLAMGRHVGAGEVAQLVAFLATEGCPSLTGATLDLNGASYIR